MSSPLSEQLQALVDAATARYVEANQRSRQLHQNAVAYLPGGNTRTVLHTSPFPLCMAHGEGHELTSEDGHKYTDFLGEFTAALYGHSNPVIQEAIKSALTKNGMNIGSTTAQEQVFAKEVCTRFHLELVRFCNSGTEANLHALAAARAFTQKRKVVTFGGGYHGAVLGFAGGRPGANAVDPNDWIVARYNDLDSARAAIKSEGVAAVLLEAMQGSGGGICATLEFLNGVQEAAKEAGVLFIVDEVMTSRIWANGLCVLRGLKPDLKTFGKWLGGGLAFGAFGGRADIMALFDPRVSDALSHSGTFNNNTLAMHAGYAGLTKVYTSETAVDFTSLGDRFRVRLHRVTEDTKICFTGIGTILAIHFPKDGTRGFERGEEAEEDALLKTLFWLEMLEQRFWLAQRGFMSLILGTPESELERFVQAVQGFVEKHAELVAVK